MQKISDSWWIGPVTAALLAWISICQINFICSWISYIPLFISIYDKGTKKVFIKGLIFGFSFSCFAFFWMIPGAERFTGYNILYGAGVFLISSLFYSLFFAALLAAFTLVRKKESDFHSVLVNSISIASVFCLAEALLTFVSDGLPWFDVHSGNGLAENVYSIQAASLFGIHVLTFIGVAINYLAAGLIIKKMWRRLFVPAIVIIVYMIAGFLLFEHFSNKSSGGKPFDVAILSENIAPDIKWDDSNGNMLVKKLLNLNYEAVKFKPAMALWSESAIPWTYRKDDELVKEVQKITDPAKITHIMGINTAYKEHQVFNSAYCILPGGNVAGRYDKQHLLSLIERPLNGWLMPFFSSSGYSALSDPANGNPVTTPFGKAGILICNEAAIPAVAARQVIQGAQFLMNLSNDGWFNDTYIVRLHYYYARIRAVECRKDIAVNSNNGFSGIIKSSGNIEEIEKSTDPFVKIVTLEPNQYITLFCLYPHIFIYCCLGWIVAMLALRVITKKSSLVTFRGRSYCTNILYHVVFL